ncbi:lytic murein transglycosylase [Nocardioides sp. DS6]|uniref:Lytic murein transglycosylase n=1 Tax=Nocardioides eburneus TaxID=3231482 RepID=A0ABV3T021_9ACTN
MTAPTAEPSQLLTQGAGVSVLPDGTTVPSQAPESPVSVSSVRAPTGGPGASAAVTTTRPALSDSLPSTTAIPVVALAAYQRAATVIDEADHDCHLDWQLLAAIGEVESHHGSAHGNTLTPEGVAKPGIYGPRLDGKRGAARVADTDGGSYDHDRRYDRALGPMQFIPSTWALVGVDANGDGRRNPQDLNDAALAAAVYLCSGDDDLATTAGQQVAVLRYNHSQAYVARVLAIAAAYRSGSTLPVSLRALPAVDVTTLDPTATANPHDQKSPHSHHAAHPHYTATQPHQVGTIRSHDDAGPSSTGTTAQTTTGPSEQPSAQSPTATPPPAASAADLGALCGDQVDATYPDATAEARTQAVAECATQLSGQTLDDARAKVADVVAALADDVDGLTGPDEPPAADPTPAEPSPSPSDPASSPAASPTADAVTPSMEE